MSFTKNTKSRRQIMELVFESIFCIGIALFVAIGFFKMLTPPDLV